MRPNKSQTRVSGSDGVTRAGEIEIVFPIPICSRLIVVKFSQNLYLFQVMHWKQINCFFFMSTALKAVW